MKKYYKRYMLDNAVARFNAAHVGYFTLRYIFDKARGYDLLLEKDDGATFEVFECMSLASAVKATWAMYKAEEDTQVRVNKLRNDAVLNLQHENAMTLESLRSEQEKVRRMQDTIMELSKNGYKIPTVDEIHAWLVKDEPDAYLMAVLWGVDIAKASVDPLMSKYVKIHPMDGELFRSLLGLVRDQDIDPFYDMTNEQMRGLAAVLKQRYVNEIRIATMFFTTDKPTIHTVQAR